MNTMEETPRELSEIEADIARTRASLNRKLIELEKRLSPSHQIAQVKARYNPRRLDPRPYPEWIAVAAVAVGTVLALRGWRQARAPLADETDLEDVIVFEAVDCRSA